MDTGYQSRHSLAGPLLLIAVGIGFLLNNIGVLNGDFWEVFSKYWPVLFIVFGLDSLYRGDGVVGAVLGIGIGSIFLLSNLGYLALDIWEIIIRFWPILIVAAGLDILLGRRWQRSVWGWLVGLLMVAILIGGIYWASGSAASASVSANAEAVTQKLENTKQADVQLVLPVGTLQLHPLEGTTNLLEGNVQLARGEKLNQEVTRSGDTTRVHLEPEGVTVIFPSISRNTSPKWDMGINSSIPVSLKANVVIGELIADLSGTQVEDLEIDMVFGENQITLPQDVQLSGNISGIVGSTQIRVPSGTAVKVHVDDGLTTVNYPDSYTREGEWIYSPEARSGTQAIELVINQLVGQVDITILR